MELLHTFKHSYYLKMSEDKRFIAQTNSSQIIMFDANTFEQVAVFNDIPNANIFFSQDGSLLLAKNNDRKMAVYDMASLTLKTKLSPKRGCKLGDGEACITSDNRKVINLGYDFPFGYISVYDLESGKELRLREEMREIFKNIRYIATKNMYFIDGFRRPEENSGGANQYFYLWFDLESETFEQTFASLADASFIYAKQLCEVITYAENGEGSFRLFPQDIEMPVAKTWEPPNVLLSHDNKKIAFYQGKDLKLYSFPQMELLCEFDGLEQGRAEFSPDDRELLIASKKGFVYRI